MLNVQVMNAVGLKLASDAAVKKLVNALLAMPKAMFRTWFRFQIKIMFLPICFLIGGLKYIYQQYTPCCDTVKYSPEPKSKVIVNGVKKLRNSVLMSINSLSSSSSMQNEFSCDTEMGLCSNVSRKDFVNGVKKLQNCELTCNKHDSRHEQSTSVYDAELMDDIPVVPSEEGCSSKITKDLQVDDVYKPPKVAKLRVAEITGRDLMWDIPIIAQKAKYYAKCVKEGDPEKIAAARKALKEHPVDAPMPKTREEYDRLMEEAKNGPGYSVENAVLKSSDDYIETVNTGDSNERENETKVANLLQKKPKMKTVEFCLENTETSNSQEEVTVKRHDLQLTLRNKILRRRLAATNNKLEEVLRACNNLFKEISCVSEKFDKFISVREKVATLQSELGEGRKLLLEVEADRNEMRSKLLALEKLIKEEEEYLDDVSCESGFDETENNGDSPDEL